MDWCTYWGNRPELMDWINTKHEIGRYLPGLHAKHKSVAYSSLEEALVDVNIVLLVVPTKSCTERYYKRWKKMGYLNQLLIPCEQKGIEPWLRSKTVFGRWLREEIPEHLIKDVVVLSGPSHSWRSRFTTATTVTSAAKRYGSGLRSTRFIYE